MEGREGLRGLLPLHLRDMAVKEGGEAEEVAVLSLSRNLNLK